MSKYSSDKMFSFQYEIVCDSVMLCFKCQVRSQDLSVAVAVVQAVRSGKNKHKHYRLWPHSLVHH